MVPDPKTHAQLESIGLTVNLWLKWGLFGHVDGGSNHGFVSVSSHLVTLVTGDRGGKAPPTVASSIDPSRGVGSRVSSWKIGSGGPAQALLAPGWLFLMDCLLPGLLCLEQAQGSLDSSRMPQRSMTLWGKGCTVSVLDGFGNYLSASLL